MPGQVQVYPHLSQAILFPIGLVDVYLLCINSNLNVMIRQELVPLSTTGMTIISFDREEASHDG